MKTEYQMVIEPGPNARAAGFRTRHYTFAKPSYAKTRKAILSFLDDRNAGRFQNTWMQTAAVYIEAREVSKWKKLDLDVDAINESTTSRPAT